MLFKVDFKSGKPVYLQVVDQIKAAAASGALHAGESLPSIRPLAEELRVNRNTIAKAYTELESQGVIETIPGNGRTTYRIRAFRAVFVQRTGAPCINKPFDFDEVRRVIGRALLQDR